MLEFFRTHQRLMQLVLLLIILPSFAFFGLQSYTQMADRDPAVAKVAGQDISQREWDAAQARQLDRFKQVFGDQFNPAMFDTPEAKMGALENLVAQKALSKDVSDKHLTVSDDTIRQTILGIPGLTGPDGKFDKERYQQLLAAQGMTPERFEAGLRHDLAMQQANAAIQGSAFAPATVAMRISSLNQQKREVQELSITASEFKSQAQVTDAMVQDYYDKHAAQFRIPEMLKAEFVVLAAPVVEQQITVSEEQIKKFYEQNLVRYKTDEQRRASHILVKAAKDAPAAEKNAAKAKAEKLLTELKKNPKDFSKVAKTNSDDPGSAERGGDLGFFGKGMMVKPFEEAAFQLKEGDISGIVESDFGYHIIQLTGIKASATRPLVEVRVNIEDEIRRVETGKKFTAMVETFTNMVYEKPDSLKPVADKLGLKIETIDGLTRQPNPSLPRQAAYNQPKFLAAIFSDDAIKAKHNTEAIEVGSSIFIAGHVVEYKPVSKVPLDAAKKQIEERVIAQEAEKLAKAAGEKKLAELKTGGNAEFGASKSVSRVRANGLPGPAVAAVMKADISRLPAYVGVSLPGKGYSIYRINAIDEQPADQEAVKTEKQQVEEFLAAQEMAGYLGVIRKRAKAEILKPLAEAKPASPAKQ
jgi:peptidyl-prolyl cis-trans isomerase D